MVAVCQRPWLARCGSLRLPVWLRLGRDSGNLALSYTQLLPQKILTFSTMCANRGTQLGTLAFSDAYRLPALRCISLTDRPSYRVFNFSSHALRIALSMVRRV